MNEMSYKKTVLKHGFIGSKIVRYVIGENGTSKTWYWEVDQYSLGQTYPETFYIHRDDGPAVIVHDGLPHKHFEYQLNGQRIGIRLKEDRNHSSAELGASKALEYKRLLSLMHHMKMLQI